MAVGPPGTGTNHTWIIGGVTWLADPAGHEDDAAPTIPVTRPSLRQRLVCTCHWVRQPPGYGVGPPGEVMNMAATSTAPWAVLA